MTDNIQLSSSMVMGGVMMGILYAMVMMFADIDSCYTLNEDVTNQELCVDGMQSVIDLMNYGVMIYVGSVGLGIIWMITQRKQQFQPSVEESNHV